jgi:OmpA-OmpF porin, OOP family
VSSAARYILGVCPPGRIAALGIALAAITTATRARAVDVDAHGTLGIAHAVGVHQYREFGFGVEGSASLEAKLSRFIGVEGVLSGLVLAKGSPPLNPALAPQDTGTTFLATVGLRAHFFGESAGPWIAARGGFAQTGSRSRPALDAALGWDLRLTKTSPWLVGPYVGLTDVVQSDDSLRPNDAYVVSAGAQLTFGRPARPAPRTDRDGDGVFDNEDACPDLPGIRTSDPRTNGCPRGDRDNDGVFDDEDACPDAPGIRTSDPKTNGCPRGDRDKDGVFDDEDACPDVPGIRTSDPATNGCPRGDRDKDGVFDDEDACPDIPGIRTPDPATNGCPEAGDKIRVVEDRILLDDVVLFDTDSPRVRHVSWGILAKLAAFLDQNPDILAISIEGHADAVGTEAHNLVLSRERAESVRRLLIKFGVEGNRLTAEAFGRSRPKVSTQRAEKANRRVEFWVTKTRKREGGP